MNAWDSVVFYFFHRSRAKKVQTYEVWTKYIFVSFIPSASITLPLFTTLWRLGNLWKTEDIIGDLPSHSNWYQPFPDMEKFWVCSVLGLPGIPVPVLRSSIQTGKCVLLLGRLSRKRAQPPSSSCCRGFFVTHDSASPKPALLFVMSLA